MEISTGNQGSKFFNYDGKNDPRTNCFFRLITEDNRFKYCEASEKFSVTSISPVRDVQFILGCFTLMAAPTRGEALLDLMVMMSRGTAA